MPVGSYLSGVDELKGHSTGANNIWNTSNLSFITEVHNYIWMFVVQITMAVLYVLTIFVNINTIYLVAIDVNYANYYFWLLVKH